MGRKVVILAGRISNASEVAVEIPQKSRFQGQPKASPTDKCPPLPVKRFVGFRRGIIATQVDLALPAAVVTVRFVKIMLIESFDSFTGGMNSCFNVSCSSG